MEILGLLDTLESMVLDGFKIPLTGKTMINEEKVLNLVDKIRLVVEGGQDFAKKAIGMEGQANNDNKFKFQKEEAVNAPSTPQEDMQLKVNEVMEQAYQIAKEVRYGADKYADEVLSNLETTTMRILRTVKAGRDRLVKDNSDVDILEKPSAIESR